jgi:hypothetical protein
MRKILAICLFGALAATAAFAEYIIVLRDGRSFEARAKWKVVDGKAIFELKDGRRMQLDPSLIDVQASETATRSGLGDAKVLQMAQPPTATSRKNQPSLGSIAAIRKTQQETAPPQAKAAAPASAQSAAPDEPAAVAGIVDSMVAEKFNAAYENVGLFERKLSLSEAGRLRIDLMADNEDQVFKAISATAFVFANVPSSYSGVDLFLRTVNGGSAGRFQMSKQDAAALANKQMEWFDYYVKNVIF